MPNVGIKSPLLSFRSGCVSYLFVSLSERRLALLRFRKSSLLSLSLLYLIFTTFFSFLLGAATCVASLPQVVAVILSYRKCKIQKHYIFSFIFVSLSGWRLALLRFRKSPLLSFLFLFLYLICSAFTRKKNRNGFSTV